MNETMVSALDLCSLAARFLMVGFSVFVALWFSAPPKAAGRRRAATYAWIRAAATFIVGVGLFHPMLAAFAGVAVAVLVLASQPATMSARRGQPAYATRERAEPAEAGKH